MKLVQPRHPQDLVFIDGDNGIHLTYQELQERISKLALVFERPKTLVFLFIRPTIECLIAYLTLIEHNHAVALFDDSLHAELKKRLIDQYRPQYIIEEPLNGSNTFLDAFLSSGYNLVLFEGASKLKILKTQIDASASVHPDLQLLLSTSGTTGSPKLIRLSKKNILCNAAAIVDYLGIASSDKALASLSFSYSYGLSVLHSHLMAGASVVLTSQSVVQQGFWEIAGKYACTSMAGVPYTYQLLDRLDLEKLLPPSMKVLTQAGGRLEPRIILKLYRIMAKRQGSIYMMYGQTEATARIAYLPPGLLPQKAGAIGIPIPRGQLQLFDDGQEILEPHKEGELVYIGDNVMMGYAVDSRDLTLGDQLHGRLHTGDVGYRDGDNIYYLTGRMKRISKVYGQRVNLDEIEAALSVYGRVAATSDDTSIYLYFESSEADFNECILTLSRLFHMSPTTFECIRLPLLPLTVSGKIDYTQLR